MNGMMGGVFRPRPVVAGVAAWLVGATASIGVGLLALSLVGEDLRDGGSALPVTAEVASSREPLPTATPAPPTATVSVSPSPAGGEERLSSAGGDLVARCTADGVYLVYWTPAPGFKAEGVQRGPAAQAKLTFESQTREIKLSVTCSAGVPTLRVVEDEHHTATHT